MTLPRTKSTVHPNRRIRNPLKEVATPPASVSILFPQLCRPPRTTISFVAFSSNDTIISTHQVSIAQTLKTRDLLFGASTSACNLSNCNDSQLRISRCGSTSCKFDRSTIEDCRFSNSNLSRCAVRNYSFEDCNVVGGGLR